MLRHLTLAFGFGSVNEDGAKNRPTPSVTKRKGLLFYKKE